MKSPVYLEVGAKRTFAGALDWPGWCRSGRDQASALQALLEYAPRYAAALRLARMRFQPPKDVSDLAVVESLKGDSTTDFGAPHCIPAADASPLDEAELRRLQNVLKACWRCLDHAAQAATGRTLRVGPRGGGRDLETIIDHVARAQRAYVSKLGWKQVKTAKSASAYQDQQDALKALAAAAHGELPARGPRGGLNWPPRYFVRRTAWHVLDHAWELEDRLE